VQFNPMAADRLRRRTVHKAEEPVEAKGAPDNSVQRTRARQVFHRGRIVRGG
jgi:hypothetical protein